MKNTTKKRKITGTNKYKSRMTYIKSQPQGQTHTLTQTNRTNDTAIQGGTEQHQNIEQLHVQPARLGHPSRPLRSREQNRHTVDGTGRTPTPKMPLRSPPDRAASVSHITHCTFYIDARCTTCMYVLIQNDNICALWRVYPDDYNDAEWLTCICPKGMLS